MRQLRFPKAATVTGASPWPPLAERLGSSPSGLCGPYLGWVATDTESSVAPRPGPFPDQAPLEDHQETRFHGSTAVRTVYHQQTKNLLFPRSQKSG